METEKERKTVMVTGENLNEEQKDFCELYFEIPKRSDGGEIQEDGIGWDGGLNCFFITFVDSAVAERVVKKQHKIAGHAVHVELYVPPKPKPCYPNKLLFRNVADSTTRDCLQMYLELMTDLEPTEILYGDEVGTVLVTFEEEPDFNKTLQMTQKKPLEKRQLTVSKVPISNCLLVENLGDKTTEDTVGYYFENKRSGGGPVERVEMVSEENKCFVYFESHEVLDGVLSRKHRLDGKDLDVKRYMECLGQSGSNVDPTAFTLPKPLVLDRLDRYKVTYLRQSKSARSGFLQQLCSSYAQGKFEGNTLIIDCTLTTMVSKARILARNWEVDVEQTVMGFLDLLEVLKRSVMQQFWQEIDAAVKGAGIRSPEGAALFHVGEESAFVVVGMKSMAKDLFDHVCDTIKTKEEEIERRNQEVTETNPKLQAHQLNLLMASGFPQRTGRRHEGLKVDIQKKKNIIVFHGLLKDVKESQIEMYELLHTVKREKITSMSDLQKKTLETKETKLYIIQKFKDEKISAVWELGQQGEIDVFAFDDPSLVKAIHIINKSVLEHVCQLSPESSQLLQSRDWQSLVSSSHRIINVSIVLGEIAKETAEVIVNSTSNGLDLQNDAVSSSILRVAGAGLQAECKSRYPWGIQVGEVARTRGHGLSCREVFHIVLCNFSNPRAQQILSGTVVSCLTKASNQQYTSLAFPVLGTGNQGYPAPLVARTMLKAIDLFERKVPSTSLRDVRIVVDPSDRNNLQEFQAAQSEAGGDHTGSLPSHNARSAGGHRNRVFAEESAAQTSKSYAESVVKKGDHKLDGYKLQVTLHEGDSGDGAGEQGAAGHPPLTSSMPSSSLSSSSRVRAPPVQVKMWSPPEARQSAVSFHDDRVLISGILPTTTSDCLSNYLECMVDMEVWSVEKNENGRSATVVFKLSDNKLDIQEMEKVCMDSPLDDGVKLHFCAVPISDAGPPADRKPTTSTILVTGLKPETATDAVQFFFSNKRRNAGGPVKNVDRASDRTSALVHFINPEDAESVVKKGGHKLDGYKLQVTLHYGDSGDGAGEQVTLH